MKKIALILFVIFLIPAFVFANPKSGEYQRIDSTDYNSAWIRLEVKEDNTLNFEGGAIWAANKDAIEKGRVNTGEILGTAKIEGNKAIYKYDDETTLTFSFLDNGSVEIKENPLGAFGGLNVSFNGLYKYEKELSEQKQ